MNNTIERYMRQNTIVVQGLGFVGLAMATVVANCIDDTGKPCFNVVGIDLPENIERINKINKGILPFKSEDNTFQPQLEKAVLINKNLFATTDPKYYQLADIVIVDIQLDIIKKEFGNSINCHLEKESFVKAIEILGENIKPNCLILIETTVPPGFCRHIVKPIIERKFIERNIDTKKYAPLIAHSYERVMPGKNYLNSIKYYYRTFSGIDKVSKNAANKFLSKVIDIENYPLREEDTTEATELAKILENTYRAVNIALIYEWTLLAEKMEVNLFSVIEGIRNRETHKNIMNPGFGVGGYCLTKDPLLAYWSSKELYNSDFGLPLSIKAIDINDKMPLHTFDLIKKNINKKHFKVAILGVSYREDVGDTRYSPTEVLYKKLKEKNIYIAVHDPYLDSWEEVKDALFIKKLNQLKDFDCIVFAVRHKIYMDLTINDLLNNIASGSLVIDANNILNDKKIISLLKNNINVLGVGKGHIIKLKRKINNE